MFSIHCVFHILFFSFSLLFFSLFFHPLLSRYHHMCAYLIECIEQFSIPFIVYYAMHCRHRLNVHMCVARALIICFRVKILTNTNLIHMCVSWLLYVTVLRLCRSHFMRSLLLPACLDFVPSLTFSWCVNCSCTRSSICYHNFCFVAKHYLLYFALILRMYPLSMRKHNAIQNACLFRSSFFFADSSLHTHLVIFPSRTLHTCVCVCVSCRIFHQHMLHVCCLQWNWRRSAFTDFIRVIFRRAHIRFNAIFVLLFLSFI